MMHEHSMKRIKIDAEDDGAEQTVPSESSGSVSEVNEADYWKKRCLLAEAFIESHVADPDLTYKMRKTYSAWLGFCGAEMMKQNV